MSCHAFRMPSDKPEHENDGDQEEESEETLSEEAARQGKTQVTKPNFEKQGSSIYRLHVPMIWL